MSHRKKRDNGSRARMIRLPYDMIAGEAGGERGHMSRNEGKKLEKARNEFYSGASRKNTVLPTL